LNAVSIRGELKLFTLRKGLWYLIFDGNNNSVRNFEILKFARGYLRFCYGEYPTWPFIGTKQQNQEWEITPKTYQKYHFRQSPMAGFA